MLRPGGVRCGRSLRPALPRVPLPLLQRRDRDRLDCRLVPDTLFQRFPAGAPWATLLPVVKFVGYHTDLTDKALWARLADQIQTALVTELRLGEGPVDSAERARMTALAPQLVYCADCLSRKHFPVGLQDALAGAFLTLLRAQALPPAPAARLYAALSTLRRPNPTLMAKLAAHLAATAPLLPVHDATAALRAIQTQERAAGYQATPEVAAAKAALVERRDRPVWSNPQGTKLLRRRPVLDREALGRGEITDAMQARLKPAVLQQLEAARDAGAQDLTPVVYAYPLPSEQLPVHRKWKVRLNERRRQLKARREKKEQEIVAKGGKIKPKKFKYKWQLNK